MSDRVSDERLTEMACGKNDSMWEYREIAKELQAARAVLDGECVWQWNDIDRRWESECVHAFRSRTTFCGECRRKVRVQS